jgi:hypothetical protein
MTTQKNESNTASEASTAALVKSSPPDEPLTITGAFHGLLNVTGALFGIGQNLDQKIARLAEAEAQEQQQRSATTKPPSPPPSPRS